MVDAYTFDKGNGKVETFKSEKEMHDWMIDNDVVVLAGDDAERFARRVEKHAQNKESKLNTKAQAVLRKLEE